MSASNYRLQRSRLSAALFAAMLLPTGVASAQATDPAPAPAASTETTDLDKVTVTGTRIARQGFITPSPVTSISAEEIRATGAVTISDLMTKLPSLSPAYTLGNSSRFIGTVGLGLLDLRGMGTARTLVLVNGRRHVGSSPGSTAVDVNTIPVDWIERVEVITGGASSVYGADAVAGVVNFILRKSFDGFEMRGQTGQADESDFSRSFVSFSAGSDFAEGRGTAAFSVEHSEQDRFGRANREIGREFLTQISNPNYDPTQPPSQDNPQRIFLGPGGTSAFSNGGTFILGGVRYLFNDDGSYRPVRYSGLRDTANPANCVDCDFLDLNSVADLEPAYERNSLNTLFRFDLNDNHSMFFEGKYVQAKSQFFGQPAFDAPLRLLRDNPFISPQLRAEMVARGQTQLLINRFNVDAGRRGEDVERQTFRTVFGFEGYLNDDWKYETSAVYGQTTIDRVNVNNRINERWQAGLDTTRDANGNIVCRATVNPLAINPHTGRTYSSFATAGCVPFSVLGEGAVSAEAAAWFNTRSLNQSKLTQTVFSASVSNSALFDLPAGGLGFAGGVEYRKETSRENTDALAAAGLTFLNAIPSRGGAYDVKEVFSEVSIPVLADLPGIDRLTVDLAGRYSDYSTIGSTSTWNLGLDWSIIPSLRFRGTYAQAVRAPSIGELFNPQSQNFAFISDPCNATGANSLATAPDRALRQANCNALGIPTGYQDTYTANRPGVSGGNPNLDPEEAKSVSLGLVWQPEFIEGFGLSMDYYRITLTDAIGAVTAQTNATRCVDAPGGINNPFCAAIFRAPAGGFTDAQGRVFPGYSITNWQALAENLAKSRRVGVDVEMDYRFDLLGGKTTLRFVGTRILQSREFAFQDFPNEFVEYVTYVTDPRWRATLNAGYKFGDWRVQWDMRYVDGNLRVVPNSYQTNPGQVAPIFNPSYTYHNTQIGYAVGKTGLDVYVGVDNVFDKDPPLNYFGTDAGSSLYDSVGRFFYVGATYKF